MSLDWNGEEPLSDEEQSLARFLNDLHRKTEHTIEQTEELQRIRDEWKASLARKQDWGTAVTWSNSCPACAGEGSVQEVEKGWKIYSVCPWCHGEKSVTMQLGRRGR